jgi:hypothetical protein
MVFDELVALKNTGRVNMLSVKEAFELSLELGYDSLADYIFSSTEAYCSFIITGIRE